MSTPIADLPFTPTSLPERDIPRETLQHAADPQVTANYMPRQQEYIPAIAPKYDYSYLLDEFRVPLILAMLYFIFQLEFFQSFLQRTLPPTLHEGSNGAAVKSVLYGGAYYGITFLMQHFK